MAIVKMKKLTLLAMNADKESIFDALVKTKAVELKRSADIDACTSPNVSAERETVLERIARVENSIGYVSEQTEKFNAANKRVKSVQPVKLPKNGFSRSLTEVGYDYFLSFGANAARIEQSLDNVSKLREQLSDIASALTQKETETARLNLVKNLPHPTAVQRKRNRKRQRTCRSVRSGGFGSRRYRGFRRAGSRRGAQKPNGVLE